MLPEGPLVKEKRGAGSGRPVDANSRAHVHERTSRFFQGVALPSRLGYSQKYAEEDDYEVGLPRPRISAAVHRFATGRRANDDYP